jgi:hypothetical protein
MHMGQSSLVCRAGKPLPRTPTTPLDRRPTLQRKALETDPECGIGWGFCWVSLSPCQGDFRIVLRYWLGALRGSFRVKITPHAVLVCEVSLRNSQIANQNLHGFRVSVIEPMISFRVLYQSDFLTCRILTFARFPSLGP